MMTSIANEKRERERESERCFVAETQEEVLRAKKLKEAAKEIREIDMSWKT